MASYVTVIPTSTMVFNNTQNSFYFNALVPDLGGINTRPQNLVGTEDAYLTVEVFGGYNATDPTGPINLSFKLDSTVQGIPRSTVLGVLQAPRWTTHFTMMP